MFILIIIILSLIGYAVASFQQIRPTERGLIERFGKYQKFANPGLHIVWLGIDRIVRVNITEKMIDALPQEIITSDNLNAIVDAQVYFKVKEAEDDVKKSIYGVNNCEKQIVQLARTTLRNIIGTLSLKEANSERNKINTELLNALVQETSQWGVEIVRTELKEIQPPADVQQVMNEVVIAANTKLAAIDFATAAETKADGEKRAQIKMAEAQKQRSILEAEANQQRLLLTAEGEKKSQILMAEGKAQAIKMVNDATEDTFKEKAQMLKRLETIEKSFANNTKIIIAKDGNIMNVIGDINGLSKNL